MRVIPQQLLEYISTNYLSKSNYIIYILRSAYPIQDGFAPNDVQTPVAADPLDVQTASALVPGVQVPVAVPPVVVQVGSAPTPLLVQSTLAEAPGTAQSNVCPDAMHAFRSNNSGFS
jgi:hypothetical protein